MEILQDACHQLLVGLIAKLIMYCCPAVAVEVPFKPGFFFRLSFYSCFKVM